MAGGLFFMSVQGLINATFNLIDMLNNIPSIRLLIVIIICLVPILFVFLDSGNAQDSAEINAADSTQAAAPADSEVSIRILCTGDIMSHMPVVNSVKTKDEKKWDFLSLFEIIAPLLESDDLTIGNLETVLAGDKYGIRGFPDFNAPQVLANDLKSSGFDLLTTSNNHAFDKGLKGLKNTLARLDTCGILHTGTFVDSVPDERSIIVDVKGIRLGIFAYTYRTNGKLSKRLARHINIIDTASMLDEINKVKSKNVHCIIGIMHFGNEYHKKPSREQKAIVRFLWRNGVQIVFGHHPHVLQPAVYDSVNNRFVIFSLGNFIGAQHGGNREYGGIADITLSKNSRDSTATIKSAQAIITCTVKWHDSLRTRYTVLPLDSAIISNLPSNYPRDWPGKTDTLPYFLKHLKSLDGKFAYDLEQKANPSDSGR